MDIREYNRTAWNRQVDEGNRWTVPVGPDVIAAARRGEWEIVLTPNKPVPRAWFPSLAGADVLCLASGGGQQGPILAAAGATVTTYDNSPNQLRREREVADRDGLAIRTVEGDMRNLDAFADESFDLIFHPCSNAFVPDVRPVWKEAYRVLRRGGSILSGFTNPLFYIFDDVAAVDRGELIVRHAIPYSDVTSLTDEERRRYTDKGEPLCFGHSLDDLIGGQIDAGFAVTGFYEDRDPTHPLGKFIPAYIATRATK